MEVGLRRTEGNEEERRAAAGAGQRDRREEMCYVGKATKIFFGVAALLVVVGFVLVLGVFRRGLQRAPHGCDGGGDCATGPRPDYPQPVPASSPPPPDSASPNGSSAAAAAASPPPPQATFPSPPAAPVPPATPPPPATPTNPVPPFTSTEPVTAAPPPSGPASPKAPPPALSPPIPVAAAAAQGPGPFLADNRSIRTL